MEPELLTRKARDIMTISARTVHPELLAAEALAYMNNSAPKVTCLFVVERSDATRRPLGVLHVHDCLRAGLQ